MSGITNPEAAPLARLALLLGACLAPESSAVAGGQQYDSFTTLFASDNGSAGNMFDVTALTEVHIAAMDGNFNAAAVTVEIYTKPGSYSGHEGNSAAWSLVGSASITGNGSDLPTPIPIPMDIVIPAGQTQAFYVTVTSSGIRYTNGTGIVYSNSELQVDEGIGLSYPFSTTYSPRTWNGTIYYNGEVGTKYCFGDGSGHFCPCLNPGGAQQGCANSTGIGSTLEGGGSPSVTTDDLAFQATGLVPDKAALLFAGTTAPNGGQGNLLGDGLRCAGIGVVRLGLRTASATGDALWSGGLMQDLNVSPGETRYFQVWYRDIQNSTCGLANNLSNGVQVQFTQ